jgi:ubiquinone/menaquinone biosynthesis C-methylase UbiE
MTDQEQAGAKAAAVYNAASDHFTAPPLSFWDRFGVETVRRAAVRPGWRVLDLCCGAGASALEAARVVGPKGHVAGIDLSERLLALGGARAEREGLRNVEFIAADATCTQYPRDSFDAVVCVFGVFFAADPRAFVRDMWRLVRPGGTLAVTTWGPGLFEPAISVFWREVARLRPELVRAYNPWDDLTTPEAVKDLFISAAVAGCAVEAVPGVHAIDSPDDFWYVVLGSGYRATVDAMSPDDSAALRNAVLSQLRREDVRVLTTDVVYATAIRPSQD